MPRVLWLPAHPASGAVSMDRYWRELEHQRQRRAPAEPDLRLDCALGSPPAWSRVAGRWQRAWQKYAAYPLLAKLASRRPGVEIVHVLDHSFAHLLSSVPRRGVYKIVTVHDLAPLRDPTGLSAAQQRRFRRTVGHVRGADLILADSHHSAGETVALLGVAPGKMRVLPLGVDSARFAARSTPLEDGGLPPGLRNRKVVLSVGAHISRKNLEVLPAIFGQVRVEGLTLLRIGTLLPPALLADLRSVLGAEGVVELGAVPDATLVQAYQRADALIFPSRIEGFGFPVLEAMAAGCPVVCTNVTSLPEVGGDAALYFAPDDPGTAAGHLRRLLTDHAARAAAVAAGLRRRPGFPGRGTSSGCSKSTARRRATPRVTR